MNNTFTKRTRCLCRLPPKKNDEGFPQLFPREFLRGKQDGPCETIRRGECPAAQGGRRHAVVDLVQGSLAIAFTPMALALAWKLISEIADSSGRQ